MADAEDGREEISVAVAVAVSVEYFQFHARRRVFSRFTFDYGMGNPDRTPVSYNSQNFKICSDQYLLTVES